MDVSLMWDQTDEFIRSGHRDPDEFQPDSFRTITLSEDEGIRAIIGKPRGKDTTEVQSYLFLREKGWTLEKAKAWFEEHERRAKESFSWAGSIKEMPGVSNLIRGKALHPIRTIHPEEEWPQVRVYLEEELQKSAHSLAGKPLILDHYRPLKGEVLGAEYEDGAIEYVAKLDDQEVLNKIRDGKIKHCSVEFEWKSLEQVNGLAPRGLNFTGLSLLEAFEPGDPLSTVEEVWEAIIRKLKEAKMSTPPNPMQRSETEAQPKMRDRKQPLWERVWSYQYKRNLPDTAYAYIKPGGEKDEQGRTQQNFRYFPHHTADGSLDPVHLRNGNSRVPQSDLTEEEKAKAKAHLDRHKRALGIGEFAEAQREPFKHKWLEQEEIEFEIAPEPTMDEVIQSIEDIVEGVNLAINALTARIEALEKPRKEQPPEKTLEEAKAKIGELEKTVEALAKERDSLKESLEKDGEKKRLGEAIIGSDASKESELIQKRLAQEVLDILGPRYPQTRVGYNEYVKFERLRAWAKKHLEPS